MKRQIAMIGIALSVNAFAIGNSRQLGDSVVTNRRPIPVTTLTGLRSYAQTNNYYLSVNLAAGMQLSFSASYGMGGEAAQASGVLVEQNGKFWFQQQANPGSNLLLPPGLPLNNDTGVSLWDIGAYMQLVNNVVFSQTSTTGASMNQVYGDPQTYLCDFSGGTAGNEVSYTDALEADFSRSIAGQSNSSFKAYYAKGIGPVALEFEEDMEPAGTFKLYLGSAQQQQKSKLK